MTLTIELSPEQERSIQARAARAGVAPEAFAREVVVAAAESEDAADLAIIHKPGRCGGNPTVGNTRITVHDLIGLLKLHDWNLEETLAEEQPSASRAQVEAAVAYYRDHTAEIDRILADRKADYERGLAAQLLRQGNCRGRQESLDHNPASKLTATEGKANAHRAPGRLR